MFTTSRTEPTPTRSLRRAAIVLLALTGCDDPDAPFADEDDALVDEDDASVEVGAPRPAASKKRPATVDGLTTPNPEPERVVPLGTRYNWTIGQTHVDMGPTSDQFCFLTAVQGKFEGYGERVHVYEWNSKWYLGGYAQQPGVGASAVCIPLNYWGQTLTYGLEKQWHIGDSYLNLAPRAGHVCVLTMIEGKLEGHGEWLGVTTLNNDGRWYLSGNHIYYPVNSWQLGGAARCITTGYEAFFQWYNPNPHVQMARVDEWVCGLMRLSGKFEGGGERLHVYLSGIYSYLGGYSGQGDLFGVAACI